MSYSSQVRVTLSEAELAAIKERLDAFLNNDEQKPLYTFLSGSVAEGLATPSSDYDVYAVYETCSEGETLVTGGPRPIEVTRISLAKIEHIVEMLLDGEDLPNMTNYELLLCHRLYCGIGLTNAHSFDQLKKMLDIDIFRKRLGDFCQLNAERSLRVSSGFVDAGDFDSAVLAARTAAKHSFNQFLVFCGATSLLDKWQLRYAQLFIGETHLALERFADVFAGDFSGSVCQKKVYLHRCYRFLQVMSDHSVMSNRMPEEEFWTVSRFLPSHPSGRNRLLEKPAGVRVVSHADTFFLLRVNTPIMELPVPAVLIWALIDNDSCVNDVLQRAIEGFQISREECLQYLQVFLLAGVVTMSCFNLALSELTDD
ncbi:nucleotidyltransferase domain-containing protein [Pseudomonas syringae]|uniref:nucleotidyltransferase domain-containing protein n=1 Tax=Pseudomonas syringae TaxID=317 RepID=UPI00215A9A8C|nr:nucleotidyltransferase domain-containing protein [Pseudomonas syringae]MCR8719299.1 nucleotidyltransferase domain-containing protein [Pseudomonas syringae]